MIAEDYLLTNRYYRRDPNNGSELPDDVKQVLGTVQASFLAAAFEAIDADYGDLETYLRDGLGSRRRPSAPSLEARYLQSLIDTPRHRARSVELRLRPRFHFHFGIEIGDDLLEGRDRLLDRRDLHQFPAADRPVAVLQRDDQIPPLLLKLNKR